MPAASGGRPKVRGRPRGIEFGASPVHRARSGSLEVTNDMRARIRATFALLVAAAMVALPAMPAAAQGAQAAPAATQVPPPPTPMVTGAANTELRLSLDEAVQRALENNADIAVARFDPSAERAERLLGEGLLRPAALLDPLPPVHRHEGDERVQRRRGRQHEDRRLELRRVPAGADGRQPAARLQQQQARHQQLVHHVQPRLQLGPHAHAAAAAPAQLHDRPAAIRAARSPRRTARSRTCSSGRR